MSLSCTLIGLLCYNWTYYVLGQIMILIWYALIYFYGSKLHFMYVDLLIHHLNFQIKIISELDGDSDLIWPTADPKNFNFTSYYYFFSPWFPSLKFSHYHLPSQIFSLIYFLSLKFSHIHSVSLKFSLSGKFSFCHLPYLIFSLIHFSSLDFLHSLSLSKIFTNDFLSPKFSLIHFLFLKFFLITFSF